MAMMMQRQRLRANTTSLSLGTNHMRPINVLSARTLVPHLLHNSTLTSLRLQMHSPSTAEGLVMLLRAASTCTSLQHIIIVGGLTLKQAKAVEEGLSHFVLPRSSSNMMEEEMHTDVKDVKKMMLPTRTPTPRHGAHQTASPRRIMLHQRPPTPHKLMCMKHPHPTTTTATTNPIHLVLEPTHFDDATAGVVLRGIQRSERILKVSCRTSACHFATRHVIKCFHERVQMYVTRNRERHLSAGFCPVPTSPPPRPLVMMAATPPRHGQQQQQQHAHHLAKPPTSPMLASPRREAIPSYVELHQRAQRANHHDELTKHQQQQQHHVEVATPPPPRIMKMMMHTPPQRSRSWDDGFAIRAHLLSSERVSPPSRHYSTPRLVAWADDVRSPSPRPPHPTTTTTTTETTHVRATRQDASSLDAIHTPHTKDDVCAIGNVGHVHHPRQVSCGSRCITVDQVFAAQCWKHHANMKLGGEEVANATSPTPPYMLGDSPHSINGITPIRSGRTPPSHHHNSSPHSIFSAEEMKLKMMAHDEQHHHRDNSPRCSVHDDDSDDDDGDAWISSSNAVHHVHGCAQRVCDWLRWHHDYAEAWQRRNTAHLAEVSHTLDREIVTHLAKLAAALEREGHS